MNYRPLLISYVFCLVGLLQPSTTRATTIPSSMREMRYSPSPYECAVLSEHVYKEDLQVGDQIVVTDSTQNVHTLSDWVVYTKLQEDNDESLSKAFQQLGLPYGYRGIIYFNKRKKQVVLAHRGTDPKNISTLKADLLSVVNNMIAGQERNMPAFLSEALAVAQKERGTLTVAGHSLGGWLAQITAFIAKDLYPEHHVKAITFDTPGALPMLQQINARIKPIMIEDLDITNYLSSPNLINACNQHVGTVYRVVFKSFSKKIAAYTLESHSMDNFLQAFDTTTGQAKQVVIVHDWPHVSKKSLQAGKYLAKELFEGQYFAALGHCITLLHQVARQEVLGEYSRFIKLAKKTNHYHYHPRPVELEAKEKFEFSYKYQYKTRPFDRRYLYIRHLPQLAQRFLLGIHLHAPNHTKLAEEYPDIYAIQWDHQKQFISIIEHKDIRLVVDQLLSLAIENPTLCATTTLLPYPIGDSNSFNEVTKTYQKKGGEGMDTKLAFNIIPDNRPSDYEYAVLSEHVYGEVKPGDIVKIQQEIWKIISTKRGKNDYFGALYKNESQKQLVLVHRGTQSFGSLIEDIKSVVLKLLSAQQKAAYDFTKEAVEQSRTSNFHLSATGHSLGALLAELSVYWCHDKFGYLDANAVTFESPGSRDLIERKLLPNLIGNSMDLEKLDIVQYLSYPNLINTWGHHIGTVYQIHPMLENLGWVAIWYTKQAHSISNIVKSFEKASLKDQVVMQDWPLGSERKKYFKDSFFQEGRYSLKALNNNKEFELYYKGHYVPDIGMDVEKQLLLKHFNFGLRDFLTEFFQLHKRLLAEEKTKKALITYWQNTGVPANILHLILNYKIDKYRNIYRVTVSTNQNIKSWRRELSSQLAQHSKHISQLLQPLKDPNSLIPPPIRSDLIIPVETAFLERPDIVKRMEYSFKKGTEGIQTIALAGIIGIGGAGKTTLARYYGRFKADSSVIFEINAETRETLINSFYNLAYLLATTPELKEEINFIQKIQNPEIKETQLLNFIKAGLRKRSNWVLIYDNIESFSQINHLFPHDPKQWGNGKVIITTRNEHIAKTSYVRAEDIIRIDELSAEEKLILFSKILYHSDPLHLESLTRVHAINFLENIPPFPLDVSIAAYYISDTQISFEKYLERLKDASTEFNEIQKNLLKEIGVYTKTRYSLIQTTIKKIMAYNPECKEVLLLIGLLDSQDIPIELLEKYNGEINIEKFIHELKRYSFITKENSGKYPKKLKTFSIHRSTQELSFAFLMKELGSKKVNQLLHNLWPLLKEYLLTVYEGSDILRMKMLVPHVEALLSHRKILDGSIVADIYHVAGKLHQMLGNYKDAFDFFQQSISLYKKYNEKKLETSVLADLGYTYCIIGRFKEAIKILTSSLAPIRQYYNSDEKLARPSLELGIAHKYAGNYEKAIHFMKQGVEIYTRLGNQVKATRALVQLGSVYTMAGNYKEAKKLLEAGLNFYKKRHAQLEYAWTCRLIGYFYNCVGHYQKAQDVLHSSLEYYTRVHGIGHIKLEEIVNNLSMTYVYMGKSLEAQTYIDEYLKIARLNPQFEADRNLQGEVYTLMGKYDLAIKSLKQKLNKYSQYYGGNHIRTAEVINSLGRVYFLKGNLEISENLFQNALQIFQKRKHPSAFISLENLSEIYLNKYTYGFEENSNSAQPFKDKARSYLMKALKVVEVGFPTNTPHIKRLQSKLKAVEE